MKSTLRSSTVAVILLVLSLVGCQVSPVPTPDDQLCCGAEKQPSDNLPVPGFASADVGELPEGTVATHAFTVYNDGDSTIDFEQEPVCNYPGRVRATLNRKRLKPGEKADLSVSFESRGKPGPFDVFVRLTPSDGSLKIANFHMAGYVISKKEPDRPGAKRP